GPWRFSRRSPLMGAFEAVEGPSAADHGDLWHDEARADANAARTIRARALAQRVTGLGARLAGGTGNPPPPGLGERRAAHGGMKIAVRSRLYRKTPTMACCRRGRCPRPNPREGAVRSPSVRRASVRTSGVPGSGFDADGATPGSGSDGCAGCRVEEAVSRNG